MKRRIFLLLILLMIPVIPGRAETLKWVDFSVPYESLEYAMRVDIDTFEQEKHISWIDILAVAGCRSGGKCPLTAVRRAAEELRSDRSAEDILGELSRYYHYYRQAYDAVLGGMLGSFAIEKDGQWFPSYGLKAFSPIASGYGYSHCDDFGVGRSFGFRRKHLGHDMMGSLGTPIVAVEGGVVEAMGWNRYGGWRIGIRSFDSRRYYYYAHLQKDTPFAPGLEEGDVVQAGDLLGFMGRTGYSDRENTNNIETVHLHFGMQLIFDESQKECLSEIWIDVYDIVRLLNSHRSTLVKTDGTWQRKFPYRDLDTEEWTGEDCLSRCSISAPEDIPWYKPRQEPCFLPFKEAGYGKHLSGHSDTDRRQYLHWCGWSRSHRKIYPDQADHGKTGHSLHSGSLPGRAGEG